MNKKTLLIPGAILAATLALAGITDAHVAVATPSCGGLAWQATNYDKTVTNAITVKVDGITVHQDLDFKASDTGSTPWPQTAPHTWSVVVNAPGVEFDKAFSGVWQACVAVTTTAAATTVAPTTTVAATTTSMPISTTSMPTPTTALVAVDIPPVPCQYNPTVPAGSPLCVAPTVADVAVLTPAEPVLPRTGLDGGIVGLAIVLVAVGVVLVVRGRRET